MRLTWDEKKSAKLRAERGLALPDAAQVLVYRHYLEVASDDPEQFKAIGFAAGRLIALIYEERRGGDEIHLVTYWPATKTERKLYEGS